MLTKSFSGHLKIGSVSAICVFYLLLAYAVVTLLGFLSLESNIDPIGDPYFTIMEILIIIIAPIMTIVMVALNAYSNDQVKIYSQIALVFMVIMTVITSSVHFSVLIFSRQNEIADLNRMTLFFSFKWPSVAYILDILAWDWFFALSFLFGSRVFKKGKFEKSVGTLMMISGVLSLLGLLGVPLNNMGIRNIGIVGYALVSPIVFIMLSKIFKMKQL